MTPSEALNLSHTNALLKGSRNDRPGFEVAAVVGITVLWTALFALVSLRVLPPIDGALFPLSNSAWLPYRDYYFPTTPGSYFIAKLAEIGSTDYALLKFRLIGLLIVPLFYWSLYRLARLHLSRIQSSLMACFGMSVMYKLGIEVLGGWNLIPLILFSTGFTLIILAKNNHWLSTSNTNQIRLNFFLAGTCFGLSIFFKHTFFIQAVAAFSFYLILIAFLSGFSDVKRLTLSKDFWWLILGITVPLSLMSYWLFSNSLTQPFIANISEMGGKNPQALVLIQAALGALMNSLGNQVALALIALILVGSAIWRKSTYFEVGAYTLGLFVFAFLSEVLFVPLLSPVANNLLDVYFICLIVMAIGTIRTSGGVRRFQTVVGNGIFLGFALQLAALVIESQDINEKFSMMDIMDIAFVSITFILCVAFIVFSLVRFRQADLVPHGVKTDVKLNVFVLTIAISSLLNIASSGGGLYLIWVIGPFTYLFARLLSQSNLERKFMSFGILSISIIAFANTAFGIANPYTWHNWKEPPLTWSSRSSNLPELVGISPATGVAGFYEKLKKLETKAASLSQSQEPKIFSFGGIPMASAISGLSPYEHNYCKFQWMDLCPQTVLSNDLEVIKSKSPDVIVIEEIPGPIIAIHEMGFLKETSVVRSYYSYAYSQERLGKWVKVGTIKSSNSTLTISVYYSTE